MSVGRPSKYSDELADRICEAVATTARGIDHICRDHGFPDPCTIDRWLASNETFRGKFARAKERQAELLAYQGLEIADDSRNDTQFDDEGNEIVNHDHIARAKLRIEQRRWLAAKLAPRKFSDKVQTEVTGADGGPLAMTFDATIRFVDPPKQGGGDAS